MRKRLLYSGGLVLLAVLIALVVWQGSFTIVQTRPMSPEQIFLLWAMSTLVFLLTVTLAFILFRTGVKLYIEHRTAREGSRIRTKLVVGALMLSFLPVFFLVLWSISVLNLNIDKWFSRPAQNIRLELISVGEALVRDAEERARAQASWLAHLDETERYLAAGTADRNVFEQICRQNSIVEAVIVRSDGVRLPLCTPQAAGGVERRYVARVPIRGTGQHKGDVVLQTRMPVDLEAKERAIQQHVSDYDRLALDKRETRRFYLTYLSLITLFILFVATWIALFLARQITTPISALLDGAAQVRKGNLGHRVQVGAVDEFATLVRAFNEMTAEIESGNRELERRRRFTEAILESIPTGVISVASDGRIQRVNPALKQILGADRVERASQMEDLFAADDAAELRYLMKRARRIGVASRQLDTSLDGRALHLGITVSALGDRVTSGFVIVIEDTSELLRAQKASAWHEVARRIAHEIKNPLTPIALSADRIALQLRRTPLPPEFAGAVEECAATIAAEVESVKTLVDEFSQFARFPAAQPQPGDLNEVIENALGVFAGRLDGIQLQKELAAELPPVNIDREQMKRVVVNLIDNAAEAMQESLVKRLLVRTAASADCVELVIADTGAGISPEDREKLFLPYFSTKGRGTGLGLAIVNHILADHHAQIRVEDNQPTGARFVIELPLRVAAEEVRA